MSIPLSFTKGHGTANDFVILMDPDAAIGLTPSRVRELCDRRRGIGADGVIRAVRVGSAAGLPDVEALAGQPTERWFMDYRNADGSISEMCGNGARVFAAFLERDVGENLAEGMVISTRGGERTLWSLGGGRYAVGMGVWALPAQDLHVTQKGLAPAMGGTSVDVGNPHVVVMVPSLEALAQLDIARPPRVEPIPTDGINVEFAFVESQTPDRGRVTMRVHERGSGETMSCGTGACAVALAVRQMSGDDAPNVWDVAVPGGDLTVRIEGDQTVLEGPAVLVADGEVSLEAIGR